MKKYLLACTCLLVLVSSLAQTKSKQKETTPTRKEVVDMMKEMQKEINGMDPEDKKMMDSMGIKMPDMKTMEKNIAGVSEVQLKKSFDDDSRIVPLKNIAKINSALAITISNGEMSGYINKTHLSVLAKLRATDKAIAGSLQQEAVQKGVSIANTGVGLWIEGKPTLALYLAGEACKADPLNPTYLNNYAAFLTMCGAEQIALPVLLNLNNRYPKNSSILNNIAQAWLRMGDIPRAEKYADSAIRVYAYHPQANMAKSLIEESKGNITAAIASAKKAISKSYSIEKENKLKKLGYDLQPDDLNWDRPMPQDPLGLEKFSWPAYPMEVEENEKLQKQWNEFIDECQEKINELQQKESILEEAMTEESAKRTKLMFSEIQKGHYAQLQPGYAAKAIKKLGPGISDINGNASFVFANAIEPITKAVITINDFEKILNEKQAELDLKYDTLIGEGKPNPLEKICKDENEIRNQFLRNANGTMQNAYKEYLEYTKRRTSDLLYYYQYTMWPDQFELVKVNAQIAWLSQIKSQDVQFKSKSRWCTASIVKIKPATLQNFDDVACQYVSKMTLGLLKITSSCSNLVGEFDFSGIKINLNDNVETGKYSGSAIVGISKGFDGPMGIEVESTVAGLVEWDNTGITDVGGIAGVSANAGGVDIAGADVKVTVNSGVSTSGSNILQGIK